MQRPLFDWDHGNLDKCARRVPVAEIEALFDGRPLTVVGDPCEYETRYRAVGHNDEKRGIFLVFTYRWVGDDLAYPADQCPLHSQELSR